MAIIECVPNFSEGRNLKTLEAIASAIKSVDGVSLLHVDRGEAANRTVFTFVGEPDAMVNATFLAIAVASEKIDMRCHHGEHPRIGAADVVPFVPVSGITLEQTKEYSKRLSKMVADRLGIPVYAYEASATDLRRRKLEYCRRGEYEGLAEKIVSEEGKPDFGPAEFTATVARSGASVIGARPFLIAVNFNLNSRSKELASEIAADVRESGRMIDPAMWKKDVNELWCRKNNTVPSGKMVRVQGMLEGCKAIGWYIEEYGLAQVSMNITDVHRTPLHVAFETVSRVARQRGARVTGTEIIGLLPLEALTMAGEYYLGLQGIEVVDEKEKVWAAIRSMSLNDLSRGFEPEKRVIEYLINH